MPDTLQCNWEDEYLLLLVIFLKPSLFLLIVVLVTLTKTKLIGFTLLSFASILENCSF